jgi:beta-galactosidase
MESYDQDYGFILYRTHISGPRPKRKCIIDGLRDRALIFLNGVYHTSLERVGNKSTTSFAVPADGVTLDILVENMGRVNYGPWLMDRKGILGGVIFDEQIQFNWEVYPLPLTNLSNLPFIKQSSSSYPGFFKGSFTIDEPGDTFLALPGWNKGAAWINGRNLGRYWKRGPQKTLYVPAPWLKQGTNELVVFEMYNVKSASVEFRGKHDLV